MLVKADMVDVLRFHREAGAALTTIAVEQSMLVPYGVLDFDKKGVVSSFEEKPALQLKINSGVYVFEPKVLDYLPKKGPAMMSDLICALLKNKQKVAAYSIPENLFIDIGQWEEFRQASKKLELGII